MFRKKKTAYIIPFLGTKRTKRPKGRWALIKEKLATYRIELRMRYLSEIPKRADLVVFNDLWAQHQQLSLLKKKEISPEQTLLYVYEPPVVDPSAYVLDYHRAFARIITVQDNIADQKRYFNFHYPHPLTQIDDSVPFEKKQLLTMVFRNKSSSHRDELYSARRRVIEYFEGNDNFQFYGGGWSHCGYHNYRGICENKLDTIKNYRFCLAYENTKNLPGYITEKIFDCFAAKCVPIYWGAPNILSYIPQKCFIDREKFENLDELYAFLKGMDVSEYQHYLDAAGAFLKSEKAKQFSLENFVDQYTQQITSTLGELS